MRMVKASIAALTVAGASVWGALAPAPASAKDIVINMAAPDWLPTRFMQEEFDKSYKSKTGNNVKLVIDFIAGAVSISASPLRSPRARRNTR